MDKRKILKSTLLLIIVGFVTKIFASIAKIITARKIGSEAMGIYMLVVPIYVFFINIIQLSLPITIATKLAANPKKTSQIMITSSMISLVINTIFMILIIILAPFFSNTILKNPDTKLSIISLALLIPLISLGGLIKGYYMGIGKIEITAYSQISEEIARILFIIIFSGIFINKGSEYLAYGAFLSLCAGEVFSLTHMIVSLPNFKNKPKRFFKGIEEKENYMTKEILDTSLPLTGGKLISVIAYSLEPIIMTNVMLSLGFSSNYVTTEYGIISGYAFPLLLLPGFFASAFGRVILQPLTSLTSQKKYSEAKKLLLGMSGLSLLIGLFFSILMFLFAKEFMFFLYKDTTGYEYVRNFAFPFLLYYIESPLISAMTAFNKTKKIMLYDTITSLLRIGLLVFLLTKLNMLAIPITTVVSASVLVILMIIDIIGFFRKNNESSING